MTQPLFAAPVEARVRVALPVPVDELFDYAVPDALAHAAIPGVRVRVRFSGRSLVGVIVEPGAPDRYEGRLLPLDAVLDAEPVLSETMLGILRDEAREILCPPGIAITAALPPGSSPRAARGYALTARGRAALDAGALSAASAEALALLEPRPRELAWLRRKIDTALLDALEADWLIAPATLQHGPSARAARERVAALAPSVDVNAATAGPLARAHRQAALLRELERRGPTPVAALRDAFPTVAALLRPLEVGGYVTIEEREAPRDVLGDALEQAPDVTLTADQADVVKPLRDAIDARAPRRFLLHGVTGSGKTEVYLRAVGEALARGRQAMILVPEITLTHQILARVRSRFGDRLAVLHSGLRPSERLEQWQRLRRGEVPIAVGARSALFAPLENLGVIVIDEEHDGAYKNDEGFRYHARDLAARRAQAAGCPVILGSATPSLETRFAADRGELERLVLPKRVGARPLPAVDVVYLQR